MTLHRQTTNKASGRVGKPTGCSRAEPEEVSALRASPPRAAFTPGPWRADFGETFRIRESDGSSVAYTQFVHLNGRRDTEEVTANAHLIAAAPDYDAAAEMLLKWFDGAGSSIAARWERIPPTERHEIIDALKAARAKARGDAA